MTKAPSAGSTPLSTPPLSQGMNFSLPLLPLLLFLPTHWEKENRLPTERNPNQIGTRLLPGNSVHKKIVKSYLSNCRVVSIELCWGKQVEGAVCSIELKSWREKFFSDPLTGHFPSRSCGAKTFENLSGALGPVSLGRWYWM